MNGEGSNRLNYQQINLEYAPKSLKWRYDRQGVHETVIRPD
ncbi:hypothetical protein GCHA_4597 [Paraglaciecola chathamensis S18K6]|uniref:Uncharacterized protein n=1 Tax=Paraglaciecola chathamensis S18K6 TaxID=1127672 RepID=A0AAV3V6X2_9ALTE|nr:hypothetical protein GCHA_4597 [Paraglaciecola chathamensis S18K6]